MIFLSNMLMISSHVTFNIPFDQMYDMLSFVFALVVDNPTIFDLPRFLTF